MKGPSVGRERQGPDPPAQFVSADWMSLTPMSITVGPVTSGGNNFFKTLVGMKLSAISNSAQRVVVPRIAPYPCGHGSFMPVSGSIGQNPDWYIWFRPPMATGMIAKDVPTTDRRPVPR